MTADEWRSFARSPCAKEAQRLVDEATQELMQRHLQTRYPDANETHSHHAYAVGFGAGVNAFLEMVKEKCHAEEE